MALDNEALVHKMRCHLADYLLGTMPENEIIAACPDDYGPTVTDDHRNYLWNLFYDECSLLEPVEAWEYYYEVVHLRSPRDLDASTIVQIVQANRKGTSWYDRLLSTFSSIAHKMGRSTKEN